jgi:hypothetical protein
MDRGTIFEAVVRKEAAVFFVVHEGRKNAK